MLQALGITSVIDVGANTGQYAREVRRLGFKGDIYSFEPGAEALSSLRTASSADPRWHIYGLALSDRVESRTLSTWRGAGTALASLRRPSAGLVSYVGQPDQEVVATTTLEEWLRGRDLDLSRSLLKIDVQGSEREVMSGAGRLLGGFAAIEVEAALRSWYPGEALLPELLEFLHREGFVFASVVTERFFSDWLGAVDVDVMAVREDLSRVPVT